MQGTFSNKLKGMFPRSYMEQCQLLPTQWGNTLWKHSEIARKVQSSDEEWNMHH